MSIEKENSLHQMEEELSKNPFVALFPSIEHAKDYIQSTKTDSESPKDHGSTKNTKHFQKAHEKPNTDKESRQEGKNKGNIGI